MLCDNVKIYHSEQRLVGPTVDPDSGRSPTRVQQSDTPRNPQRNGEEVIVTTCPGRERTDDSAQATKPPRSKNSGSPGQAPFSLGQLGMPAADQRWNSPERSG